MNMKVKDFINFLKLPPNILFAISLVSGAILFVSDSIIAKLYMADFRNKYGFAIAIVFLISTSILIILFSTTVIKKLKKKNENKKLKKAQIKYLLDAEPYKVKMIQGFIKNKTHTLQVNANDGLTVELSHFGIISMAGSTQPVDFGYGNELYLNYFLQPWVIKLIDSNEELKKKYKVK